MTFIQPNKNSSFLNAVLVILVIALAGGVFGMVALYNATVNLDHNIAAAKTELDAIGAQTTGLNNKILATLGGSNPAIFAAAEGLVLESKPQYYSASANQTGAQWPIASHY